MLREQEYIIDNKIRREAGTTGQRGVALCGEVYTHIKDDHAQRWLRQDWKLHRSTSYGNL